MLHRSSPKACRNVSNGLAFVASIFNPHRDRALMTPAMQFGTRGWAWIWSGGVGCDLHDEVGVECRADPLQAASSLWPPVQHTDGPGRCGQGRRRMRAAF